MSAYAEYIQWRREFHDGRRARAYANAMRAKGRRVTLHKRRRDFDRDGCNASFLVRIYEVSQ